MKNYTITVNGTVYDVTVEENVSGRAPAPAAPKPAPKPAPAPAKAAPAPEIVLEAMKMEVDVVAQEDGTIATINVAVGDAVESGDVLATMN